MDIYDKSTAFHPKKGEGGDIVYWFFINETIA